MQGLLLLEEYGTVTNLEGAFMRLQEQSALCECDTFALILTFNI